MAGRGTDIILGGNPKVGVLIGWLILVALKQMDCSALCNFWVMLWGLDDIVSNHKIIILLICIFLSLEYSFDIYV